MAQETVLPPKVLKNSMPLSNDAAMSGGRHDRTDRMAVADRLAEHDDVGHHSVKFEPPEMIS